ncbi:peptidase U32 family protein [Acholeplasma hippikon]|uniref:Putative protease n=1 Tax=Acholeplasma hippikon TaxID=264636 RepID=A0A449BJQ0_9MOLU|nr:U32 family peptidase [Acholeplasma hippikon]VEU82650.1 putative protease [Acholeplasma hippikon]
MKILTTIHDLNHLEQFSTKVDGFLIGQSDFSKHLTLDLKGYIVDVIEKINKLEKEVFIQFNRMYTNSELNHIDAFLSTLDLNKITGFMCADIGLLQIFKKHGIKDKFVYNPETLLTNYFDFNYLKQDGILGAFASKEITAKDIKEIGLRKEIKLFMFGHGHMSMFYSKRQILNLYADHMKKDHIYEKRDDLRLKEPKRENERYPVFQDEAGTYVFRGYVMSSLAHMDELSSLLDYFVIDTLFQSDEYVLDVVPLYKDHKSLADAKAIMDKYEETWHDGFLSEKTMIKGE